jgi:L-asparaginase
MLRNMRKPPHIFLLGTGGTIASTAPGAATLTDYSVTEGVASLVSAIPEIDRIARVECRQVFELDSIDITNEMLVKLASEVAALLADPAVDGIVVTHGTDTLEETAYFLNLTLRSNKPVVLVGAMRPSSALSQDGALNLRNAILLASSREARGLGVLVALNDRFFASRFVSKMNTTRVDAFDAPDQGSLGLIADGHVLLFQSPASAGSKARYFELQPGAALPVVDIIYDHQSARLNAYLASIEAGANGIVVAACGNGSLTPNAREGLQRAVERGIVCVRSSRVPAGVVTHSTHDEPAGLIAGNTLNPQKSRILLMLALTRTTDRSRIQHYFDRY